MRDSEAGCGVAGFPVYTALRPIRDSNSRADLSRSPSISDMTLAPAVLALILCARAGVGAIHDASGSVLALLRASLLAVEEASTRLVGACLVPGLRGDVVVELRGARFVEGCDMSAVAAVGYGGCREWLAGLRLFER